MAWIDFRKAHDSVPHDWLLKCLNLFGVHKNICLLIAQSMLYWRTTLTCCGVVFGDVKICRGIFQGDSLSPLLFVISLMPLSYLLRKTNKGYCLRGCVIKVSHLLYLDDIKLYSKSRSELDSLVSTVSTFSGDICMSYGVDKCLLFTLRMPCGVLCYGLAMWRSTHLPYK